MTVFFVDLQALWNRPSFLVLHSGVVEGVCEGSPRRPSGRPIPWTLPPYFFEICEFFDRGVCMRVQAITSIPPSSRFQTFYPECLSFLGPWVCPGIPINSDPNFDEFLGNPKFTNFTNLNFSRKYESSEFSANPRFSL